MDERTLPPALERLLASPRLRLAVRSGSGARGALRPDSDLDLGVLPRDDLSLDDELGLQVAFERATGRRVDLVRLDRAAGPVAAAGWLPELHRPYLLRGGLGHRLGDLDP